MMPFDERRSAMQKWAEALKEGDEVSLRYRGGRPKLAKVDRVTPTQIVIGGTRYRKTDAQSMGSGFHFSSISPVTDEVREMFERDSLLQWLNSAAKIKATLPQLRAMKAAYEAAQ
jgi:hypothetical protein